MISLSEASCVSQVLTAQAVASDMGQGIAMECGVQSWASCSMRNSERDTHRTIGKQSTRLEIPLSSIDCDGEKLPWISPETWFTFLVTKGLWPVLAGCNRDDHVGAVCNWKQFWKNYKEVYPNFELFDYEDQLDFGRVAAVFLHGDEGRTLKRQGMMVTSVQSALGRGYDEKRVKNHPSGDNLRVNFAGHSFTTRFVLHTIPKTCYESNPEVFHSAMSHVAKSLRKLLDVGVVDVVSGETLKVALIGVKGDAPYLVKVGHFYRSYNTMAKRGEERSVAKGVCPYCLAGTRNFPSEEINSTEPKWRTTVGVKAPWVRTPAIIQHCLHDRGDPASFFRSDIWHVVHLGFGRSWVASVIQTILPMLDFSNLDQKWDHLTTHYLDWCRANRKQSHISKITPYLMSYNDTSGAMGNWHKGALTSNLFQWLVTLLSGLPRDGNGLVLQCLIATNRMNALFSFLYHGGVFLSEEECKFVAEQGIEFLKTYYSLACFMFRASKQWLYPLYPKLHIFHHLMLEVRDNGKSIKKSCNPLVWSCQLDEDVVGRCSRLSRRVNVRTVALRTMQRYLISAYFGFVKAKWLG